MPGCAPSSAGAVDIVGEAGDVDAAVAVIVATRPDVVLLDVHLPGGGGRAVIETVRRAAARTPLPRPVGVGRAPRTWWASSAAGARGYVTKTIDRAELVDGRAAASHAGDAVFSPRLAGFVLDAFSGRRRRGRRASSTS